ncbi:MAG: porin [Planctomycetes bacterium]|nr:porin [Planctomycetota bacterium]
MPPSAARRTFVLATLPAWSLFATAFGQTPAEQEPTPASSSPQPANDPATPQEPPLTLEQIAERLRAVEQNLKERDHQLEELKKALAAQPTTAAAKKDAKPAEKKWYDKLSVRGYLQFRYTTLFGQDNTPDINVPADPTVNEPETFYIRRGRVILSGDVTDHLFVYAQMDFNGSVGGGGTSGLQMRDYYGDIAIDEAKEHRFRIGQSKVPFGWVNLQSSQNRGPMERPDAINSAAEGERDIGAFYYWAPAETRELFKQLVRDGLKGSGDYGVFGFGAYSGQGPNRSDQNGQVHWIARASYPFHVFDEQVMELGVQGYTGHYVSPVGAIGTVTPTQPSKGTRDERVGVTAIWYPQPFGLEAEWNWGHGPKLRDDFSRIEKRWLQGGYVQASFLEKGASGTWFPFVRWNFYDGGRKFARNAPDDQVSEIDLGTEWSPWPEVELTLMYTHTFVRTNTSVAPYDEARGEDRIGFQVQINF